MRWTRACGSCGCDNRSTPSAWCRAARPTANPRRALLLGNYLAGEARRLLVDTWSELGLEVAQVGTVTRPTMQPEDEIAAADIVVGKARAVLDAMACGRPAYVYDAFGGDGWVTADHLRRDRGGRARGAGVPRGHRRRAAAQRTWRSTTRRWGTSTAPDPQAPPGADARPGAGRALRGDPPRGPRTSPPVTEARELARQVRLRWRAEEELAGLRAAFHRRRRTSGRRARRDPRRRGRRAPRDRAARHAPPRGRGRARGANGAQRADAERHRAPGPGPRSAAPDPVRRPAVPPLGPARPGPAPASADATRRNVERPGPVRLVRLSCSSHPTCRSPTTP